MSDNEELSFMQKVAIIGFVSLIVIAGIGVFWKPPTWFVCIFAFCNALWFCWLISTYIFYLFHPEWESEKRNTAGFFTALFIVINLFAWALG